MNGFPRVKRRAGLRAFPSNAWRWRGEKDGVCCVAERIRYVKDGGGE